jgi:hypothetical protein
MKRLLVFPLLTIVLSSAMAWPVTPVAAASSVDAGWWTSSPLPPPDVPGGGLEVQGGPDVNNPVAFAAVSFALDPGETAQSVRLAVTGNAASTPNAQLMVCPLTTTFAPASGAAMSQAPEYDCAAKATASPSGDGKTYTFDVSRITATSALAVAILPTQPTDRVVFDAPSTGALTSAKAPAATTTESSPTVDAGTSSSPAYSSAPSSGSSFDVPSTPDVVAPASGTLGNSETSRGTNGAATTGAAGVASGPTSTSSKSHSRALVPLALGLALVASALWFTAGVGAGGGAELAEEPR